MFLRFENTSAERIIVTLDASGWWPVGCAKEGHLSPLLLLSSIGGLSSIHLGFNQGWTQVQAWGNRAQDLWNFENTPLNFEKLF